MFYFGDRQEIAPFDDFVLDLPTASLSVSDQSHRHIRDSKWDWVFDLHLAPLVGPLPVCSGGLLRVLQHKCLNVHNILFTKKNKIGHIIIKEKLRLE